MLALILVSANFVLAADDLNKSYNCLRQKISEQGGYSSLSNELKAFSLLALSSNATEQLILQSAISSSIQQSGCLSAEAGATGACSLKTTGIGLLALTLTGANESQIESWLNSQTNVDSNTEWYLEIDSGIAECDIYSGNDLKGKISLDKDKKISGSLSSCFSYSFGGPFDGYWLKIDPSCYNDNITTICNETFVTSLIYKKSDSDVYYIPDTASSAPAGQKTYEKVNAFCFGACNDYIGSLWATTALKVKNGDIEKFKPYLYTLAQSNQELLPSAFLFKISDSGTKAYYKTELLNKRASIGKYWQPSTEAERNYYTSLAVWVLGKDSTDASAARDYLKEQLKLSTTGCLGDSNIRDTAFALFAVGDLTYSPIVPVNISILYPNQTTTIDTAYPTIDIQINTKGAAKECSYKIDNANSGNLSLDYGTTWRGSANVTTSSYFSQHSITVYCKNIAGQEKTASKEFNLSIVSMNISITQPKSSDTITSQTITVKAQLNTESRGCTFYFDSGSKKYNLTETKPVDHLWSEQGTIPVPNGFPDRGKHSVTVFCFDTLGNEINKKEEFSVNLEEPEPPTNGSLGITITNPRNDGEYSLSSLLQYVNLTTTGAIKVDVCTYYLDSGSSISMIPTNISNSTKWFAPLNITFNSAFEGNHSITAICTDIEGNSAQKTIYFIFNTTSSQTQERCTTKGYFCLNKGDCTIKTDGTVFKDFSCDSSIYKECCSENIQSSEPTTGTCYDEGGIPCGDDEECDGTTLDASDTGNCCEGTCRNIISTSTCESEDGQCRLECISGEEEKSYLCENGGSCCVKTITTTSKSYWWVWVLLILIILTVVGIVFREKIKEFYFKIMNKGRGSAGSQGRPPFGPGPGMPPAGMGMPRRMIPGMNMNNRPGIMPQRGGMPMRPNMPSARPFPKDKELNDTLAKLKNMGGK